MSEPSVLDNTFSIIMKRMVETGQAPHYTEIALELGVSAQEGRSALLTCPHQRYQLLS